MVQIDDARRERPEFVGRRCLPEVRAREPRELLRLRAGAELEEDGRDIAVSGRVRDVVGRPPVVRPCVDIRTVPDEELDHVECLRIGGEAVNRSRAVPVRREVQRDALRLETLQDLERAAQRRAPHDGPAIGFGCEKRFAALPHVVVEQSGVPSTRRGRQGRRQRGRLAIHCGRPPEQQVDGPVVAAAVDDRVVERRVAERIREVEIRPLPDEQFDRLERPAAHPRGGGQRRESLRVARIDVGAFGQRRLDDSRAVESRRPVQRAVDLCPLLDQGARGGVLPAPDGFEQRCEALGGRGVNGRPERQKTLDHRH